MLQLSGLGYWIDFDHTKLYQTVFQKISPREQDISQKN